MDATRAPFVPKLKLTKWKDQREEIRMRGETLRQDSPKLSINDILSDTELHSLWQRIGESLQLFKSKAVEVT
eukprot:3194060-Rhodomonas_salina.1